jgi:hypothetical protein
MTHYASGWIIPEYAPDLFSSFGRAIGHQCNSGVLGVSNANAAGQRALALAQRTADLRPGTVLEREWNRHVQRVAVLADGFAWNGKTYPSLSKVAVAITGTRWSGPRFFGLRDKPSKPAGASRSARRGPARWLS